MSRYDAWRLAVGTLTVCPVRPPSAVDRGTARAAMLLAPLAVLPLGVVAGAIWWAADLVDLPALVAGLLVVGALALGTRVMHWDGLSDVADGLTASYDRERSLAVMKTGTSGPAGTVAVVVVAGLQAGALGGLSGQAGPGSTALLVGLCVCASRAALTACCLRGVPAARSDGLGVTFAGVVPRSAAVLPWLAAAALLAVAGHGAGLDWWRGPLAVALALAVVVLLLIRCRLRLGGVTGDVFGAAVELGLATLLVALA
ncbi:MAG: adenosylcobinamide-GDP ribazoletransferase [Nocardioides sp.]|uniref:adenosylcobinamide-GDP ribazoletransferase n=1 Tax=Nocardioides sp. TaxID=35761 RepID=UPI0039E42531